MKVLNVWGGHLLGSAFSSLYNTHLGRWQYYRQQRHHHCHYHHHPHHRQQHNHLHHHHHHHHLVHFWFAIIKGIKIKTYHKIKIEI